MAIAEMTWISICQLSAGRVNGNGEAWQANDHGAGRSGMRGLEGDRPSAFCAHFVGCCRPSYDLDQLLGLLIGQPDVFFGRVRS
ncbi:hypothetical protein NAV26_11605 [Pseudomonas stutzeri]|uniref:hypothetical protein n=1 Tax=Stutzerimonas stutzeri TaxID=316 RepID=UPI0011AF3A04|nr:hypothetical protein [Stutzerimonas stutzeri]MCQ4325602.1 hypothetical protein [Stutzerimonas stutzeri]